MSSALGPLLLTVIANCFFFGGICRAQEAGSALTCPEDRDVIEVAVVRHSNGGLLPRLTIAGDHVDIYGYTVAKLIAAALHRTGSSTVRGGAPWLYNEPFDLRAKLSLTEYQLRSRLDATRRDRESREVLSCLVRNSFHLRTSVGESRQHVLALVPSKSGTPIEDLRSRPPVKGKEGVFNIEVDDKRIRVEQAPMAAFAEALQQLPELQGLSVVDQTGLTGRYTFSLDWRLEREADADRFSSLTFSDIQQALRSIGLSLTRVQMRVPICVIESAAEPNATE